MRKGPLLGGAASALGLLALFFSLITLISDWGFARTQFSEFWYFILPLSAGFGVQVGLYLRIRDAVRSAASKSVLAVSGTASGGAMLSCCTHYLVNILPIIGISGLASFAAQYQIELFWFGLILNFLGVVYLWRKWNLFRKHHA